MTKQQKILIIGIAGGLAQMTARLILTEHPDWEILGIDSRDVSNVSRIKGLSALNTPEVILRTSSELMILM